MERKGRPFNVVFRICPKCPQLYDFVDFNKTPPGKMPYYNEIDNLKVRLIRGNLAKLSQRDYVILMRDDPSKTCIKCKTIQYSKLYIKIQEIPKYVGYLCKKCETCYFVNTAFFKPNTVDPKFYGKQGKLPKFHGIPFSEYMGSYITRPGAPTEEAGYEYLHLKMKSRDIQRIRKMLIKQKIVVEELNSRQ